MGDSHLEPIPDYAHLDTLIDHQDALIQRERELEYKLGTLGKYIWCCWCCNLCNYTAKPIYKELRAVKYDLIALEKQIATLKGS